MIHIVTFGTKTYRGPKVPGFRLDCTGLPNPWHVPELKHLDGRDQAVKSFISGRHCGHLMRAIIEKISDGETQFGLFCIGGRHRSVALAELTASVLRVNGHQVKVSHMSLERK